MKAIVLTNWPKAEKGDIVEVTEHQLLQFSNHLEAVEAEVEQKPKRGRPSKK